MSSPKETAGSVGSSSTPQALVAHATSPPASPSPPPGSSSPASPSSPVLVLPRVVHSGHTTPGRPLPSGSPDFILPRRPSSRQATPSPRGEGSPTGGVPVDGDDRSTSARTRMHRHIHVLGGLGSPAGHTTSSSSGPAAAADEGRLVSPHAQWAVVPFTPSVTSPSLFDAANSMQVSGENYWALSTRRVCPTCLRPYDEDGTVGDSDRNDFDEPPYGSLDVASDGLDDDTDGSSEAVGETATPGAPRRQRRHRSRAGPRRPAAVRQVLSPQYFRGLGCVQPLAIEDAASPAGAKTAASPPAAGAFALLEENPSVADRQTLVASPLAPPPTRPAGLPPLICHVSPTRPGKVESIYADISVDPTLDLGVEWSGRVASDSGLHANGGETDTLAPSTANATAAPAAEQQQGPPPDVRSTTPYHEPSDTEEMLPGEVRDEQRRQNEDEKQRGSPVVGSSGYYGRYFVELQKLGSGTYGGVYLCQHVMEKVVLGTFALKKVPVGDNVEYLQKVLHEVRILEEVKRHPNVVEYNHSWVETAQLADFGPPVRCLFILMEYATEGSLDAYLERYGTALSTVAVWYFFLSAVAGTAHLHQKQILHRDLKPQNLLLTGPPGMPPRMLVSDFGTSALLGENGYERTGGTGTLEYMAPELLEVSSPPGVHSPRHHSSGSEQYVNHHTKASDVWSLGMILYYLACDATLPAALPDGSVALNVNARSPYTRPPEMIELMRAMLQRDPRRRPSCNEILSSTVAQTILRSFNRMASSGGGATAMAEDVMPHDLSANGQERAAAAPAAVPHTRAIASKPARHRSSTLTAGRGEDENETAQQQEEEEEEGESSPHRLSGTAQDALQSSRVELMSATVMSPSPSTADVPLLMQYRTNDAAHRGSFGASHMRVSSASNGMVASPSMALSPNAKRMRSSVFTDRPPSSTILSTATPTFAESSKRPRMVDAEVQTDPVVFADS